MAPPIFNRSTDTHTHAHTCAHILIDTIRSEERVLINAILARIRLFYLGRATGTYRDDSIADRTRDMLQFSAVHIFRMKCACIFCT